ncbi:MAG: glycosyltransferase [Bacteroidota bacterium]
MKILLVSSSVLPYPGGSSVIVEQLAQNFSRHELLVLGSAPLLGRQYLERPSDMPAFLSFPCEFSLWGRGHRYFKWLLRYQFKPLVQRVEQLVRENDIDYIIGVYPNDFFCHAACRAAQNLKIPFSSYFHNTYVENTNITDPKAQDIQDEIFSQSEHIFVMSKGMQRFYEEKYQLAKFVPLVHTFDVYPPDASLSGLPGVDKEVYQLVAIGNFNESNIEATRRFLRAIENNQRYELNVYTHVPPMLLRQRGLDTSSFHLRGFVKPEEVHNVLQQYDICVLTHGFTGGYGEVEYRTIFPTRTIPMLLSGKPILAHSPPNSFLNDFISENRCASLVDEASESSIIATLDHLSGSLEQQEQLVQAARKTAEQFYGPNVVQTLKEKLA